MAFINSVAVVLYLILILVYGQRNNDLHQRVKKLKKILKIQAERQDELLKKIKALETQSKNLTRQASTVILIIPFLQLTAPELSSIYIGDIFWPVFGMFIGFSLLLQGVFYIKGESVLEGIDTDNLGGGYDFF